MVEDHIYMLFQGMLVGFMASVLPGPVGLICIQRTLNTNRLTGFVSGLGAATADMIFAMLAVFFLSLVTSFIESKEYLLKVVGGILVIILGLTTFYKTVRRPNVQSSSTGTMFSNYFSVFFLTLTNPMYIFTFIALFAIIGVKSSDSGILLNFILILGVFVGSASWWFLLTWTINKARRWFTLHHIWWINKITGSIIVLIGALIILSLVVNLPVSVPHITP